jgi:glyoxalase family protein
MILGLHHVTALAGDARQNLEFYTHFLGLRLVKRTVNYDDPGTHHFYFGDSSGHPGTLLTFFPWGRVRTPRKGAGQAIAVAFAIAPEALGEWSDRAARRGLEATPWNSRFGEAGLTIVDPDGLAVELVGAEAARNRTLDRLHSVTLCEREIHNVLGWELAGVESNRHRFRVAAGEFIDILHEPAAEHGKMGAGAIHHVALRVADEALQWEWRTRLISAGMRVSPVKDRSYFHSIYFRRPGSTLFEIATDGPGFLIDEPAELLGTGLCLPRWLEPHRAEITARLPPLEVNASAL